MSDAHEAYNATFSDILNNEDLLGEVMESFLNKPTQENIDNGVFKTGTGIGAAIVWALTCKQMYKRHQKKYPGRIRTLLQPMCWSRDMLELAHSIGGHVHIDTHPGKYQLEPPSRLGRCLLSALAEGGDPPLMLNILYEGRNEPEKLPDWMHDTGVFEEGDTTLVDAAAKRESEFLLRIFMLLWRMPIGPVGIYNFFRWNMSDKAFLWKLYRAKVINGRKQYRIQAGYVLPNSLPVRINLNRLLPDTAEMVEYAERGYAAFKDWYPNRLAWLIECHGK